MIPQKNSICRFGVFELNLRSGELRKQGIKLHLQDQPYQVLVKLIENNGEIVSREDLRSKLWHGDTFVDFETGLNTAIKRLRETLGDSAENPTFIETLPRKGYRFIVPVEWPAGKDRRISDQIAPEKPSVRRKLPFLKPVAIAVAGVAVLLLIGVALWSNQPQVPSVASVVQITNDGKAKVSINPFVTDGANLYFIEGHPFSSGSRIAQVSTKGGETTWIDSSLTEPLAIYSFSPSRSEMMLIRGSSESHEPGTEVWVQPLPAGAPHRFGNFMASAMCWAPDGAHIVYADDQGISIANPDGTESHLLAKVPGMVWTLRVSPDGRRVRFTLLHLPGLDVSSIWEMDANGNNPHPVFPDWKTGPSQCCGNWSPDGQYFYFQTGRGNSGAVWVLPERSSIFRKGAATPTRLTYGPLLGFGSPTPSVDGKSIYVVGDDLRVELFRYNIRAQRFEPYLSGFSAGPVNFSADGSWMVYTSYPDGTLWRSRVDGSEKMQLTFAPFRVYGARLSPDGTQIVFMDTQFGRPWKIYQISSTGGTPELLVPTGGDEGEFDPMWMPDGKSIVFGRNGDDISIRSLNLETKIVSSIPGSVGLTSPRVSPDGRYICALNNWASELMVFDSRTGQWTSLVKGEEFGYNEWSHDGKYIYMRTKSGGSGSVVRIRLKDHALERVVSVKDFPLPPSPEANWTGLTRDDDILLMRDRSVQEIYALDLKFH